RRVGDGKAGAQGIAVPATPAPAAARAPEAPNHAPIDVDLYVCVHNLDDLDRWIARAHEAGVVAFDTETDALSASSANLCGISLAVAPGDACYIPVGHEAAEGLALEETADLTQIPIEAVMERLKPLLEDPTVLKVA